MKQQEAKEIIECLPRDRTLFYYYRDRYAAWILESITQQGEKISDLKKSCYGGLLNKPIIQALIKNKGNGEVDASDFKFSWQEPSTAFMLTLDTWDGSDPEYDQTTRKGVNLVLQLNFSNLHNDFFHRVFNETMQDNLRSYGHPALDHDERDFKHETLAWSRMDINLETGEALIEEIQNDWLRYAKFWRKCLRCSRGCDFCYGRSSQQFERIKKMIDIYLNEILKPYYKIWDEAMLAASVWFLKYELGIQRIYYHHYQSGTLLKSISGRLPPRSLYTDLPRKFCFQQTTQHPEFLINDRYFKKQLRVHKNRNIQWQLLNLETSHAQI